MRKILILSLLIVASYSLYGQNAHPYFSSGEMPNAVHYLPSPPSSNEMRFAYDSAQYQWGKSLRNTPRGEKAKEDARWGIGRMSEIFSPIIGVEISPSNTPALWTLLNDAIITVDKACDSAKITYMRTRPFMYYKESTLVPSQEKELMHNGSYPSGHTTLGWGTALLLCEICPECQDALLAAGFEYGQSRVIAGFHWQSDVDAGRLVASAAYARLHSSKAFMKQVRKAQKEFQKKKKKVQK